MKKLNFIVLTFFTLMFSLNLMAVPAQPGIIEFEQPNGYVLNITLHGDEFVHWAETTDGYTVLQNKDGYYVYAIQTDEGSLKLSGQIAHNPNDRLFEEMSFVGSIKKGLRFSKEQIDESFQKWGGKKSLAKRGGFPTTGTNKMIMILANFADTETSYTQSDFDDYMNQENYDGTGSFRDYYMEVSYGQLVVNTTVTVWVTLPNNHDYYGDNYSTFAYHAVTAADPYVDYSEFDNDGDGDVDGIAIIHQGPGQEATGDEGDIWSHSSSISNYGLTLDGVDIGAYTTQPEKSGYSMASIGVMCHEFGHNLGAPDYYDTNYETGGEYDGTGQWDIMANGSYNLNGRKPAHHNPYTKWKYYEWITPTLLNSEQTVTMENSAENSTDFYYYMTPSSDEFWLLENRQKIGFDSYVPGHGLVIYHADESYINMYDWSNSINAGSHQGFYPVCAFASGNPPSTYGNINSASTPFPGYLNNTEFTDMSTPSSLSWAGVGTGKPITGITETGTTITFDFMADVYLATFTITDSETNNPILNASITVGNQSAYTNSSGVATFTLLDGNYDYTITKYGYGDSSGSFTIAGADVSQNVALEPAVITYTLSFKVKNNETSDPINGASIEIDGSVIYSDANGDASIDLAPGSHSYVINKTGYAEYTGSAYISVSNLIRNINMIPTVGVNDGLFANMKVYPNPVNNQVNIDMAGQYDIAIYNTIGKLLKSKSCNNTTSLDVNDFSEGIYFVKISKFGSESVHKFIIRR
jgi:M6 family metalloprotease-like protein